MNGPASAPVVVGIDGSDESMCAADYGAWEAGVRQAPLRLVYARRPTPFWGPSTLVVDEYAWEQEWVRGLLSKSVAELKDEHPGLPIEAVARSGGPASMLIDESATAAVVVVGTRAAGGIRGHLSASVAVQVASHAACPVVAVRGTPGRRCDAATFAERPVLVGYDGSEPARRALEYGAGQADARHTELQAVLAWALLDVADPRPIERDLSTEQRHSERLLDDALAGLTDRYPHLRVTRHAIYDVDPVRVLLDGSQGAGLVVVGSRGGGGFLGLRLGSTVDGVIRNAHCPVAVVH